MTHFVKVTAITAISYFLAGWLGQMFAVPPGYATIIWPASGIALALCLLFGYHPLLGVFLGSMAVNISISFNNTGQIFLIVPSLIAVGSTLQTFVGYWLVHRFIGSRLEFYNVRHVLLFILLGGPVGCLVSASVGTSVLYSFGLLSSAQAPLNWLSWWLGDSVGVIVVVPWLAALLYKRFRIHFDHPGRVLASLLVVAIGTVMLSVTTAYFELNKQRLTFQSNAELNATSLSERIKNSVDILYGMAGLVRASELLEPSEFADYASNIMSRDRAIKALSINYVISDAELAAFEELMSVRRNAPFKVVQKDSDGKLVPVAPNDRHVVVGMIFPEEPNRQALGYDVYSEPSRRQSIDRAIRLNAAYPTPAIQLVQNSTAVLMFLPVYRADKLIAMATGMIEISDLSNRILSRHRSKATQTYLLDQNKNGEPYILAASGNDAGISSSELLQQLEDGRYRSIYRTVIPVGAHRWELLHVSAYRFIAQPWGTHFALVGGLFVAGLLGWMLCLVFSHAGQIERQVKARTKELSLVNEALRESGKKLTQAIADAQEANLAKSRFLANMSHEIRTPLNGMLGSLSLLQSKMLSSDQQKLVELASQSGDALLDLINDILDLSKIEAGELDLEMAELDLQTLLEDVASLMRIKAQEKGVELIAPETLLPAMKVTGDRARIRQVMVNLIGNAIKFTPEGGKVRLIAEIVNKGSDVATIRISVVDNGIGISGDLQSRLFQRFKQIDSSTTRRYGGTGLGLAISRELVEAMQGEIGVTSTLGEGATFWFSVPFAYQDDEAMVPSKTVLEQLRVCYYLTNTNTEVRYLEAIFLRFQKELRVIHSEDELPNTLTQGDILIVDDSVITDHSNTSLKQFSERIILLCEQQTNLQQLESFCLASLYKPVHLKALCNALEKMFATEPRLSSGPAARPLEFRVEARLLLVEDNLTNQIVAKGMLALFGAQVDVASDGESALEQVQRQNYDLIFMDCQMPIMDGYEATRRIRLLDQNSATSSDVPIVALSANAMKGDDLVCIEAGMNDHVAKPVSKQTLEKALKNWIPQHIQGSIDE
ncbi:histidine kinase [Marinomonas piezotolerans]|uniref:histidine kinase n=2 Tax=Marinomonas piezotolerans TaxID=2213058 RepID=A0A370U663_9GAMM|nr:histidine kinase [Marinomonas piezotolerans]